MKARKNKDTRKSYIEDNKMIVKKTKAFGIPTMKGIQYDGKFKVPTKRINAKEDMGKSFFGHGKRKSCWKKGNSVTIRPAISITIDKEGFICRNINGFTHMWQLSRQIKDSYLWKCKLCGNMKIQSYHIEPYWKFIKFFVGKMETNKYFTLTQLSQKIGIHYNTLKKVLSTLNNNIETLDIKKSSRLILIRKLN